jgi:hypothetical protein
MKVATRAGASPRSDQEAKTKKVRVEQEGKQVLWWQRSFIAEIPADCDSDDIEDELTELADEAGIDWEEVGDDEVDVTETNASEADPEDEPDVTYEARHPLHCNPAIDQLSYFADLVKRKVGSEAAEEFRLWLDRWGGQSSEENEEQAEE